MYRFGSLATNAVILGLLVFTNTAHAGLLSSFFGAGASAQSVTTTSAGQNSQKMPLLEAPLNPQSHSTDLGSSTDTPQSTVDNALLSNKPLTVVASSNNTDSVVNGNKISTYVVQKGDNLSSIAAKFDISLATILWANNLSKNATINVGQKLVILPITGVSYKVTKGDNLGSIAQRYKADIKEIMAFNNIDESDQIKIGDTLIIPNAEASDTETKSSSSKTAQTTKKVANTYYKRPITGGTRTQGVHGHNAVDLADSCGTPIYASAAGIVEVAQSSGAWDGGYGNYVVIDHENNSQTLSAHMQNVSVAVGERVAQGQQIGTIGSTGEVKGATGCHIHFEIRNGISNPF